MKVPIITSQMPHANGNAGAAARYQHASAFMSEGQSRMPDALNKLAAGMDKLNAVIHAENIREREDQLSTDLTRDLQEYRRAEAEAFALFQEERKGADARGAVENATAFHDEKLAALQEAYKENPVALNYIERQAGALRGTSIDRFRAYATSEEEAYKKSVYEGELALGQDVLLNWQTSPAERQQTYADLKQKTRAFYGSRGRDATEAMTRLDTFARQAETAMWRTQIADLRERDPQAALALLEGKTEDGSDSAFAANFESGGNSMAIGYDKTGGTSYGKFQIASGPGTMGDFIGWLEKNGHGEAAKALQASGPANTGSQTGAMPETWKTLVHQGKITDAIQEQFIRENHVGPALAALPKEAQAAIANDPAMKAALFSTAVQHGPGGAGRLLRKAWDASGGDKAAMLQNLYASRAGEFGSSTAKVRASVQNRLLQEHTALDGVGKGLQGSLPPHELAAERDKVATTLTNRRAEESAETFYQAVECGQSSLTEIWKNIEEIKDTKLRETTYKAFSNRMRLRDEAERAAATEAGEMAYDNTLAILDSDKSDGDKLSALFAMTQEAEVAAIGGGRKEKAYHKSIAEIYKKTIDGQQFGLKTNPTSFLKATDGISDGSITSVQQLKASCPDVSGADMKKLEGLLTGAQKVDTAAINRQFRIFEGMEEGDSIRGERQTRLAEIQQEIIDAAKESNRGNDPEWIKEMVKRSFLKGETKGSLWFDPDTTYSKARKEGKEFFPDIAEEERSRFASFFGHEAMRDLKNQYVKRYGNLEYAYRARALHEQQAALLPFGGPSRPVTVPADFAWNAEELGWVRGEDIYHWMGENK